MNRLATTTFAAFAVMTVSTTAAHAQAAPAPVTTPVSAVAPASLSAPRPGATYAPVGAAPAQEKAPAPTETYTAPAPGHAYQTFSDRRELFVMGDYLIHPRVHDEFTSGEGGRASYRLRGGTEFNLGNFHGLIEGNYRQYNARHEDGPVTVIGRNGSTFVPAFNGQEEQADGRLGIKLLEPRLYLVASYLTKSNNAGYPKASGLGLGAEKLPDREGPLSVYFSTFYYPNLTGEYRMLGPNPGSLGVSYRMFTYEVGAAIKPSGAPIFLDAGLLGDRVTGRNGSPSNQTHIAPYVGIGFFTR